MDFLRKLWDETFAGPTPDTGLGKLRKCISLSAVRSDPPPADHEVTIIRSIMITKTRYSSFKNILSDPISGPDSPSSSIAPTSPLTPGTPIRNFKKFTRRKSSAEEFGRADSRSQAVYDWLVLSALDR
ncbi:putative Dormancy/auxin associated family protein [Quillaja saponaria]|uniref:Dormancy/auxin associated family protein n=1 Tax=Quillaja saponaria TaxID=32244 RepID=A0AAD7LSJ2_QUISA|nr:putative Dormancy/auxin associated family protein [Quillaja saponaria]